MPEHVGHLLAQPTTVGLTQSHWVAAAFLGGLRTTSNARRGNTRDRGDLKNALNDIQGMIGELIALEHLDRSLPRWTVEHSLLDWSGGATHEIATACDITLTVPPTDVDVLRAGGEFARHVSGGPVVVRLEAKSHLHLSHAIADSDPKLRFKRDFAVNRGATIKSYERHADAVIPLATAPGAETAVIGRSLRVQDILLWDVKDYGYDDLALAVPLERLSPLAWQQPWSKVSASLEATHSAITLDRLHATHDVGRRSFETLRNQGWNPPAAIDGLVRLCASKAIEMRDELSSP